MSVIFFIKSATVDISKYTIKDIPGSSGRLDVISRCILAAIINGNDFEENIQIWVYLDKYGTFIFNSNCIKNEYFPKNEILLSDFIAELIKKKTTNEKYYETPLDSVKYLQLSIYDAINSFVKKKFKIYVLDENGRDFREEFSGLRPKDNLLFILGDQSGDLLYNEELKKLNLTNLSLGNRSYLASSTIRLIKMNLQLFI